MESDGGARRAADGYSGIIAAVQRREEEEEEATDEIFGSARKEHAVFLSE